MADNFRDASPGSVPQLDMRRIRKLSLLGQGVALVAIALILASCLYLVFDRALLLGLLVRDIPHASIRPTPGIVLIGSALAFVPVGLFLLLLWQAFRFFRLIGDGGIFQPQAPALLGKMGRLAIMTAVAGFVCRILVVLVLTSLEPAGQRMLTINISSNDVASLIVGLLFQVFALIMQESLRLEEDNRSFV